MPGAGRWPARHPGGRKRKGRAAPRVRMATRVSSRSREFAVGVGGHAVAAVAVVVEPDGPEPNPVVAADRHPEPGQRLIGQLIGRPVPPGQAGVVDHAVVHPSAVVLPVHHLDQPGAQVVGAAEPASGHVDPGPAAEIDPVERRGRAHLNRSGREQTALRRDGVPVRASSGRGAGHSRRLPEQAFVWGGQLIERVQLTAGFQASATDLSGATAILSP